MKIPLKFEILKKSVTYLIALCISAAAFAQQSADRSNTDYHERMKAEKIAFITDFVGLSPEEAQSFWPVYNEIEARQNQLQKEEHSSYRELRDAQKSGEGDFATLLDKYLSAKSANVDLHVANVEKYSKILPLEKLSKFYTSEEKYRRELISRYMKGNGQFNKSEFRPEGSPSQPRPAGNRKSGPGREPQK